jgi:hypothetical protein
MTGDRDILQHVGKIPLVALPRIGRGLAVPVLVKCEHMNPGGSVKDRIAKAIVDDAERRGVLRRGMTLIEATARNTGFGLALVAAARDYKLVCVMPEPVRAISVASRIALFSTRIGFESRRPIDSAAAPSNCTHAFTLSGVAIIEGDCGDGGSDAAPPPDVDAAVNDATPRRMQSRSVRGRRPTRRRLSPSGPTAPRSRRALAR